MNKKKCKIILPIVLAAVVLAGAGIWQATRPKEVTNYDVEFEAGSPYMQSKDKLLEECVSMIPYTDASSIRYKAGLMTWNKDSDVEKQIYNGTITAAEFYEGNYNFFTSAGENRWDYYYSRR